MKKYRAIVPLLLILLMGLSWHKLVQTSNARQTEYRIKLKEARNFADLGITKLATERYIEVLKIKSSPDIYAELAEYYKTQKLDDLYQRWSSEFVDRYPTEATAYEHLLEAHLQNEDYTSCYNVLNTASKRGLSSDRLKEVEKQIYYQYVLDYNSYQEVGPFGNDLAAVQKGDKWGFINVFGSKGISNRFSEARVFTNSGFAAVIDKDQVPFFIDKQGERVLATKEKYRAFGPLTDERVVAQKGEHEYTYLDAQLQPAFGKYTGATAFNQKLAAVKQDAGWSLIDIDGKQVSDQEFEDIIVDDKGIFFREDRAFAAKEKGKFILINTSGKQVGEQVFEDARLFLGDSIAAVKQKGKWFFIDKDGKAISDKTYEDARSFSNGLAAVKQKGKWGFVDKEENIAIEAKFADARDFNTKGSCFVKVGDIWQLLKLYRLNRE